MGFDTWVARNDRNKSVNGARFGDLPRMKDSLPLRFDDATNKTIELIDMLWLKGNAIVYDISLGRINERALESLMGV